MADVAETVNESQPTEKEVEKKVVDVEDGDEKKEDSNDAEKPKENGSAENGAKKETNGDSAEVAATKRKSGAGDTPDGAPAEGATPEKKAKISKEDKEAESEATNGEAEVVA